MKFKIVLTNTDFDLGLIIRFVKCYVWTVLLYGMDGWPLKVSTMKKLEAFEMCVYRRVLRIPWTYQFLQLIIEGKIKGKRGIGRKKMSWLRNVRQWTGLRRMRRRRTNAYHT